jgi:hypothetical protein
MLLFEARMESNDGATADRRSMHRIYRAAEDLLECNTE